MHQPTASSVAPNLFPHPGWVQFGCSERAIRTHLAVPVGLGAFMDTEDSAALPVPRRAPPPITLPSGATHPSPPARGPIRGLLARESGHTAVRTDSWPHPGRWLSTDFGAGEARHGIDASRSAGFVGASPGYAITDARRAFATDAGAAAPDPAGPDPGGAPRRRSRLPGVRPVGGRHTTGPREGPLDARLVLVGEQPGDQEDLAGAPFVGPAGRVLDEALERAGIERREVFVTNAVKHFRYRLRGKRRIHQSPDRWQVNACLPWLRAELSMVTPEVVVCLGATAAQALLGPSVRIGRDRGRELESDWAPRTTVTTHPSAILRIREAAERREATEALIADLATVASWVGA